MQFICKFRYSKKSQFLTLRENRTSIGIKITGTPFVERCYTYERALILYVKILASSKQIEINKSFQITKRDNCKKKKKTVFTYKII